MRVSASDPAPRALETTEPAPAPQSSSATEPSPSFLQVLRGLGREINRGEATMRSAVTSMGAGSDLGPAQLIALQAGVYRYSEAIDLASRLVDRATSGVKTVVQGGGQ
jgi:hypothetical protein